MRSRRKVILGNLLVALPLVPYPTTKKILWPVKAGTVVLIPNTLLTTGLEDSYFQQNTGPNPHKP